jgi:methylmalonyl-CoA/ethylmalonyl-CoA epimerase
MASRLNHIGVVVQDVLEIAEVLRTLGLEALTKPEPDPVQKVTACFMGKEGPEEVHIELLEPTEDRSPIAKFLGKKGGGLHHLCFEVDDIDAATRDLEQKGFKVVSEPVECIGYDRSFNLGKECSTRIAFLMTSNKLLIELLQKGR